MFYYMKISKKQKAILKSYARGARNLRDDHSFGKMSLNISFMDDCVLLLISGGKFIFLAT